MTAYGGVTATLHIAGQVWEWPVYVAPIRDTVLLGIDLLRGSDAKILVKQGDLVLGEDLVIGRTSTGEEPVSVLAKEDEVIPPGSERVVIGRVAQSIPNDTTMVLDPSRIKNGLQVGTVLVTAKNQVPVRVLNLDM